MPYYCTVPRCTSMAGKAKNVSFHQFPRDEELARLWNDILKRGKPYTKYSKVCSLHFKPEDYTITSVGKNKGQWRTLRKDAVPSQNLPSETPAPYSRKQWDTCSQGSQNVLDPSIHQQMAQAIYMQTMLAMQAASPDAAAQHNSTAPQPDHLPNTSTHEELKNKQNDCTYRCTDCTKCFKDPDVFILHKRTHTKDKSEKENFDMNLTLRSNPILANLLKSNSYNFDPSMLSMESLLMTALAANMDYLRNFSTIKEENYDCDNRDRTYNSNDNTQRLNDNLGSNDGHKDRSRHFDPESSSDVMSDLSRLKSDLSRRSVEIHVRNDLSHPKNDMTNSKNDLSASINDLSHRSDNIQLRNDLSLPKTAPTQENFTINNENYCPQAENHRLDPEINLEDQNNATFDMVRPIGYAVNFTSKEIVDQIIKRNYNDHDNMECLQDAVNGGTSKNISHCDNDLNESLDSNRLVIDETA